MVKGQRTYLLLGVVAGPTFDGFIVEHTSWSVEFWWTIALQGIVLILVFSFLEETCFDRSKTILQKEVSRHSFLVRRLLTFFSTKMVARTPSVSDVVSFTEYSICCDWTLIVFALGHSIYYTNENIFLPSYHLRRYVGT